MLLGVFIYLLISLIIGAIATLITGYTHMGCLIKIIIGFIGTLLGYVLTSYLRLPDFLYLHLGERPIPLLWSLICAIVFVSLISILVKKR